MGIRQFHNKFRAYFKIRGIEYQLYYPTEKEAFDMMQKVKELNKLNRPIWSKNNQKRCDAKHKDLPVGFYQSRDTKHRVSGETVFHDYIKCTFIWNGKPKSILRSFGDNRTREQAIYELIRAVTLFFRENKEKIA